MRNSPEHNASISRFMRSPSCEGKRKPKAHDALHQSCATQRPASSKQYIGGSKEQKAKKSNKDPPIPRPCHAHIFRPARVPHLLVPMFFGPHQDGDRRRRCQRPDVVLPPWQLRALPVYSTLPLDGLLLLREPQIPVEVSYPLPLVTSSRARRIRLKPCARSGGQKGPSACDASQRSKKDTGDLSLRTFAPNVSKQPQCANTTGCPQNAFAKEHPGNLKFMAPLTQHHYLSRKYIPEYPHPFPGPCPTARAFVAFCLNQR